MRSLSIFLSATLKPDRGNTEIPMKRVQIILKYGLDLILAIVLLVLLSPFFLVISITIFLFDGGPIFFRQQRRGYRGRIFNVWKFRTMIVDADDFLSEEGVATKNRITRTGRWLRFLSLDELPQLLNILRREMSFIGPRPALVEHFNRYTSDQKKRLLMKPGVTGLAQVNGRNTLKWSRRIEYDIEYIENYSLILDLKILLRTVGVVLFRKGIVIDRNPDQVDDLMK